MSCFCNCTTLARGPQPAAQQYLLATGPIYDVAWLGHVVLHAVRPGHTTAAVPVQAQPWHSSARCNCTSSSTSSSSGRDGPWAPPPPQQHHHHHSHLQHHFTLPQQPVWHRSLHAAHISLSSPAFAGRALSTSCSPWQQPAVAESADAPDSSPDRGPALSPAADPKPIVGVCKRRNLKCGWKKIDFVLRMVGGGRGAGWSLVCWGCGAGRQGVQRTGWSPRLQLRPGAAVVCRLTDVA